MRTSADQLARYLMAFMNGGVLKSKRILSEASYKRVFTPRKLSDTQGGQEELGLVWHKSHFKSGDMWGHYGGDPGVRSAMFFDPERSLGAAILCNAEGPLEPALERLFQE